MSDKEKSREEIEKIIHLERIQPDEREKKLPMWAKYILDNCRSAINYLVKRLARTEEGMGKAQEEFEAALACLRKLDNPLAQEFLRKYQEGGVLGNPPRPKNE